MILDFDIPLFWTVECVLGPSECDAHVRFINSQPREVATINAPEGQILRPEVRNNTRVIHDDQSLANDLWKRVAGLVPQTILGWKAVGVNERFRYYRYDPGQRFAPHYDGAFARHDEERSMLTFMIYLNEGMTGGATRLLDLEAEVAPRMGRALFFQHQILHEGAPVLAGEKYVLRSDIMYSRTG